MALTNGTRNNGGHSTKAKKPIDKRKNEYREALKQASTVDDVIEVLVTLRDVAKGGDIPAIKLFLEYYLGRPKESLDITSNGQGFDIKQVFGFDKAK